MIELSRSEVEASIRHRIDRAIHELDDGQITTVILELTRAITLCRLCIDSPPEVDPEGTQSLASDANIAHNS